MACEVCIEGEYLIIDQRGGMWGYIACPACGGSAMSDEEIEAGRAAKRDRDRYIEAMAAMGNALTQDAG